MSSYCRYGCWVLAFTLLACGGKPSVSGQGDKAGGHGDTTQQDGGNEPHAPDDEVTSPGASAHADGGMTGGNGCQPATCDELDAECGPVPDGCGGVLECGGCTDGEYCGIVEHNRCTNPNSLCVPIDRDVACADKACGKESDGCQGVYECGSCGDGEACGVAKPFQCDALPTLGTDGGVQFSCVPLTAEQACAGKECGVVFDGCGATEEHQYDCSDVNGGCAVDEWCGIQEAFQCDPAPGANCGDASSCAELGWECGMAVDDCGNVIDCGEEGLSCDTVTEACVGIPAKCVVGGGGSGPDLGCDVCHAIPQCNAPEITRLTGRAVTPGRSDDDSANQVGVPNAFVYILRTTDSDALPAIPTGIPDGGEACDRCDEQDLGPVLASATTDARGEYELSGNIPVGTPFLLVTKIGKWRRAVQMELSSDAACETTAIEPMNTRLPRTRRDGIAANIPRIAISTGNIDAMECVFYKMGVSGDEFRNGSSSLTGGRIHIYQGGSGSRNANTRGGLLDRDTPFDDDLHESPSRLLSHDMVVFDCEGTGYGDHNDSDPHVREYVNRGGRVFASHLSATWLDDNGSKAYSAADRADTGLSQSAVYDGGWGTGDDSGEGRISVGRPDAQPQKVRRFADWLLNENAVNEHGPDDYRMSLVQPRELVSSVGEHSEEFVYRDKSSRGYSSWVQQFAFNTPYGAPADAICGRVAYSAFHVSASGGSGLTPFGGGRSFPGYCADTGSTLNDQEKTLLYMLFDLAACVSTNIPDPPSCNPVTDCTGRCGPIPDGCGGLVQCGGCASGESCLEGGVCSDLDCIPTTCEAQGAECGLKADGCGAVLNCGPCPEGQGCGVVTANRCDPLTTCPPRSCEQAGAECGVIGDGCGGVRDCGQCPAGEVCGIVQAHRCDPPPSCVPTTCEARGAECGTISDGCSDVLDCGECPSNAICGAVTPNRCFTLPSGPK